MSNRISRIENDVQDRNSPAWAKLCEYVDIVEREKRDEFSPLEFLGQDLYSQIYTLPQSICKLKYVKKVWLYGSKLKQIPPEIGAMTSLEYFDPYTSYDLHWFPYEITRCRKLIDSRVSTRALYGNFKNRMGFPRLADNPVRYFGENVCCSICRKEMSYSQTNQLWISLRVGTDVLPLLANLCSKACETQLPEPPEGYLPFAHKGGSELKQPTADEWDEFDEHHSEETADDIDHASTSETKEELMPDPELKRERTLIKFIRKIWER